VQQNDGHRGHDLHRFLTFIDACIAIAVTLLVLPLVEAAGGVEKSVPLSNFLDDHQSLFWSFLLSFTVIAMIWSGHHTYVSLIGAADRHFVLWVLGWTLCLVLLPVPTALISRYDSDSGTVPLYVGLLLGSALFSAGLATHVSRTPTLWAEGVTAADVSPIPAWVTVGCYAVALAVGTTIPNVNFYALLVLVLVGPISGRLPGRRAVSSVEQ
jgi:uncharacterized membrane protein